MKRVFLTVLDAVGCGELPDAALYGDVGANTFGHVVDTVHPELPNLARMGLGQVEGTHYPPDPVMLELCMQHGIYVVDEANIECHSNMTTENERLTEYLSRAIIDREYNMVRRDRNHPCVVMWSLGNEPDTDSMPDDAYAYWHPLYETAHRTDPQNRPVTVVGCQNRYERDRVIRGMDVVLINRYYGWYNLSGDLEAAQHAFRTELDWWENIHKPVILSEYGADTVAGMHGAAPEMFTEEFQVAFYEATNACLDERDFIVGEMPWNFADFATCQGPMRVGGNRKGLFTRDRKPKMAAHYFRNRWKAMDEKNNAG